MHRLWHAGALSLRLFGLFATSCGGGSNRVLKSISISPNPAVAKDGTVQLVATGRFSSAPVTVSPLTVIGRRALLTTSVTPLAPT